MTDGRPERADGGATEDLLEGGTGPSPWQRAWTALPPGARRLVVAAGVVVLVGAGLVWLREQAVERGLRQQVELAAALGVHTSSTSPLGGSVRYFVVVRNDGPRPVRIESLRAAGRGLELRLRGAADRRVAAGEEVAIPLSVRLSCAGDGPRAGTAADPGLAAEIGVRRADGGASTRRVELGAAALVLDLVDTTCRARPELVDQELSGPVLGSARHGG